MVKALLQKLFRSGGLFSGSVQLISLRLLAVGVSFGFTALVSRIYGAETLGLFALMNIAVLIAVLLTKSGLDIFFLREVSQLRDQLGAASFKSLYSKVISLCIVLGLPISALLYFSAEFIAVEWFQNAQLIWILQLAAIAIIPMALNAIHAEGFRGMQRLTFYISMTRIWPFLLCALAVLFWYSMGNDESVKFFQSYVAAVVITAIIGLILWFSATKVGPGSLLSNGMPLGGARKIFNQSLPMMLASSMFLIMSWTDTFMLGLFQDVEQVGQYHVAVKVSNMVSIVLYGVNGIAAPRIARSWKEKSHIVLKSTIANAATLSFVLAVPVCLVIIVFRTHLLALFGPEMIVAATALAVLAVGQFVNGSCGSVMNILQMTGHQNTGQYVLMFAAALNVALNFWLIPIYGIEGAAVATAMSTVVWNLLAMGAVRWKLGLWSLPFATGLSSFSSLFKKR